MDHQFENKTKKQNVHSRYIKLKESTKPTVFFLYIVTLLIFLLFSKILQVYGLGYINLV